MSEDEDAKGSPEDGGDERVRRLFDPQRAYQHDPLLGEKVADFDDEEDRVTSPTADEMERAQLWSCAEWRRYVQALHDRRAQLMYQLKADDVEGIGRLKEVDEILTRIEQHRRSGSRLR